MAEKWPKIAQKLPKMAQKLAPAKKTRDISPVSPTFCISTMKIIIVNIMSPTSSPSSSWKSPCKANCGRSLHRRLRRPPSLVTSGRHRKSRKMSSVFVFFCFCFYQYLFCISGFHLCISYHYHYLNILWKPQKCLCIRILFYICILFLYQYFSSFRYFNIFICLILEIWETD